MQINVLLPSGTRTVDLDELKELVRQGVVQPSTLLETGGQRGKAKNVPALKPIFAELVAAQAEAPEPTTFPTSPTPPEPPVFPSTPTPPEPPVFSPISTPPEPPQFDAPSTFPDFSTFETPQPAPSFDDVYGLEDSAAPNAFATETPSPEDAPSDDAASSAADSNSPFYFDARSPIPLPKRFRKSNKGFYVGSLKALRSAELAHWVAWGRGFLRVFDVLFLIVSAICFLVYLGNAVYSNYQKCQSQKITKRIAINEYLNEKINDVGYRSESPNPLEIERFSWFYFLPNDQKPSSTISFQYDDVDEKLAILELAEKKAKEIEKKLPRTQLSETDENIRDFIATFKLDIIEVKELKKELNGVRFPHLKFWTLTFGVLIVATLFFLFAAFLYGLATILFRLLFSAADLYAASFRDDFDPAANKRRDDLLASVETIKTNGVPATQDANAV